MTIAFSNGYAITFSEEARARWSADRAERLGPAPGDAAATMATLARLGARLGPGVVRRRDS